MTNGSYYDLYSRKFKKCKSKKDYKRLCKEMINLYSAIDHIDQNQWRIFSSIMGEEEYLSAIALSIKMYILESQGLSCNVVTYERDCNGLD